MLNLTVCFGFSLSSNKLQAIKVRKAPFPHHFQPVVDGGGIRYRTDLGREQKLLAVECL